MAGRRGRKEADDLPPPPPPAPGWTPHGVAGTPPPPPPPPPTAAPRGATWEQAGPRPAQPPVTAATPSPFGQARSHQIGGLPRFDAAPHQAPAFTPAPVTPLHHDGTPAGEPPLPFGLQPGQVLWPHQGPEWGQPLVSIGAAAETHDDTVRRLRKRRHRRTALSIAAFVAVVAGSLTAVSFIGDSVSADHSFSGDLVLYSAGKAPAAPVPEAETATITAPPQRFVAPPGLYRFIGTNPDSSPIRWDPCKPIHLVVNESDAPPGGVEALRQAIDVISKATNLKFVIDGPTDERPSNRDRSPYTTVGGTRDWAPVLIAWARDDQDFALDGSVLGYAIPVPAYYAGSGYGRIVTGSVILDADDLRNVRADFGQAALRSVIEHELTHLVGLDHVSSEASLMNPSTDFSVTSPNPDDRVGLLVAGGGMCFP